MAIDKKKAVKLKQLSKIIRLFWNRMDVLYELAQNSEGSQKDIVDAIILFREAPKPSYLTGYEDPKYDQGRALVDRAVEAGDVDGVRLLLYIESGLSVKVKPKREEELKEIFQKLYEMTGDEEIPPILENFSEHRIAYLVAYEDARYDMACDDYAPSYGGTSHDESYYENIRHAEDDKK